MYTFIVRFSLYISDSYRNRLACTSDVISIDVLAEKIGLQKNEIICGTVVARISFATCFVPMSGVCLSGYSI